MRTELQRLALINELEREEEHPPICIECKVRRIKTGYRICKECAKTSECRFALWDLFEHIGKAGKFERWKLDIKHSIVREGKNGGGNFFVDIVCSKCGVIIRVETKPINEENWQPGTPFRYECSPPCKNIRRYPKQPKTLAFNVFGWPYSED